MQLMNLTLRQLRAFVLVARSGSFTRAAKSMHLTQSALSQLVRELEGALNTRLVDRTTRSVSLTATGKEFVASSQRILDDLEQAIGNVDKLVAKQRGRVVIASPVVLASNLLPPVVARFREAYSGIELILSDSLPNEVLPQVRTGAADLGIGTFSPTEHDLQRRLLFKEAMGAVFPASHPFARATRLTWKDLATTPVLTLRRGSVFRDLAEAGFSAAGLTLEPSFETNFVGSLIGLVDAGLGVAIVPGYAAVMADKRRIAWKRLVKPVVEREVLMIHRADSTLSPAAQAFADFLVEQQRGRRPAEKRR
jgi:DNA-binding transcriptional LysR family regulator